MYSSGPSTSEHQKNLVNDPFAATLYFEIVMRCITEHLIGVRITDNRVKSIPGVLGLCRSYFGAVESQGRGNLHCHLLLWLANTPNNVDAARLLDTEDFREKLRNYVCSTISADVEGFSVERAGLSHHPHPHPCFQRPPNPSSSSFDNDLAFRERTHVETSQVHNCRLDRPLSSPCLVRRRGGVYSCKRRAPWKTSEDVVVYPDGHYDLERRHPYINGYNKWIHSYALSSNGDLKVITNGNGTKDIIWYMTTYATKAQSKTNNLAALLSNVFVPRVGADANLEGSIQSGKRLLHRTCLQLNTRQEISSRWLLQAWRDGRRLAHLTCTPRST